MIVGTAVWSSQHKFRVVLGPMGYGDYLDFLPSAGRIRRLVALVRNYAGDEWAWDVNLVLKREEVPLLSLDGRSRLGWTTWLGERTVKTDADDLIFKAPASAYRRPSELPQEDVVGGIGTEGDAGGDVLVVPAFAGEMES
jgi:predicted component of type VI protein secretion system